MRIGYAPYDHSLEAPGDRRRFVAWARARGVEFEIVDAPKQGIDVAVVSLAGDLTRWRDAPPETKVILDVTDDYLGLPDRGLKNRARGVAKFLSGELSRPILRYGDLLADACRRADIVVCTSEEQRARVVSVAGQDRVTIILDLYDTEMAGAKRDYARADGPSIAWEGQPYNVATLELVRRPLNELPPDLRPSVHLVSHAFYRPYARRFGRRSTRSVAEAALPGFAVHLEEWDRSTIGSVIASCDVAIIPLDLDDPFARSKSAQKLVGLWAIGMPVVTSATPAYAQAMEAAGLDHVCRTDDDWKRALTLLLADEGERRRAAYAGRAYVDAYASRDVMLSRWDDAMTAVGV